MTRKHIWGMLEKLEKGECYKSDVMDAVDAYSSALIAAKPLVIGSLPDDSELEDWLFDGYERNPKNLDRLKIGRVVRDRIAQKMNSGNDR